MEWFLLILLIWCIIGAVSYVYGAIKSGGEFYGFAHLLFWVLLGPAGLLLQLFE